MTKREISDKLQILRESLKGQAKNHACQSDDPNDYYFGYAQACETYAARVDAVYQAVLANLCK